MPPKVKKVSRAQGTTIRTCLIEISVAFTDLEATENIEDEWKVIKKSYFRAVLQHHPDKGGEAVKFRAIHAAWEVLKDLFEKKSVPSFVSSGETPTSTVHEKKMQEFDASDLPTQSWEYFQEAAQEVDPPYRVEPARSNRSSCSAKNGAKKCSDANIAMGEVRIGRMNKESGTYGYWTHIPCWRVASKIWKGLPDPDVCTDKTQFADALHSMNEILFSGFTDLTADQQGLIVEYVMDKTNWAKQAAPRKRKDEPVSVLEDQFTGTHSADSGSSSTSLISSTGSTALVTQRQLFQIPVPGRDGPANTLSGKSCVMTG